MTSMGTRQPLLLLMTLTAILLVSVSHGAPSGSLEDSSGGDDDLPEYRLHPRPSLYRYKARPASARDFLNSVYASPAQDVVLDNPETKVPEEEDKTVIPSSFLSRGYPPTPPPFAPELTKDTLRPESGGLGPFSLLDQLQPSLW